MRIAAYCAGYEPTAGGGYTFESEVLEALLQIAGKKPGVDFVLLCPEANAKALGEHWIAGAGLDVSLGVLAAVFVPPAGGLLPGSTLAAADAEAAALAAGASAGVPAAAATEACGRPSASAATQPANSSDSRTIRSADHPRATPVSSGSICRAAAPMNRLAITQANRSCPASGGNASPPAA